MVRFAHESDMFRLISKSPSSPGCLPPAGPCSAPSPGDPIQAGWDLSHCLSGPLLIPGPLKAHQPPPSLSQALAQLPFTYPPPIHSVSAPCIPVSKNINAYPASFSGGAHPVSLRPCLSPLDLSRCKQFCPKRPSSRISAASLQLPSATLAVLDSISKRDSTRPSSSTGAASSGLRPELPSDADKPPAAGVRPVGLWAFSPVFAGF